MNTLYSNRLKNYIVFLERTTKLINDNIETITKSPSIDYKKYYLKELNNFNIAKIDNNIELLKKSFECKKNILKISTLGTNLLNDIILYCNKYKLKEVDFFDYVEKISPISLENKNKILISISKDANISSINTTESINIHSLFSFYFEINNISINLKEYKNTFIQDNIYLNLKFFSKTFNLKNYNQFI